MPFEIWWEVPGRVIANRVTGPVDAALLADLTTAMNAAAATIPANITYHIVSDLSGVTSYPRSLAQLRPGFRGQFTPNIGWMILITQSKMLHFLSGSLLQLVYTHVRLRVFPTYAEGTAFVRGLLEADALPPADSA